MLASGAQIRNVGVAPTNANVVGIVTSGGGVSITPLSLNLPFYWLPLDQWTPEAEEYALSTVGQRYSKWQAILAGLDNICGRVQSQGDQCNTTLIKTVCIGIAAFSFLIDFDAADQMIRAGAPEKAAWGIALGLTVTLVWLYLEFLRLLSKISKR